MSLIIILNGIISQETKCILGYNRVYLLIMRIKNMLFATYLKKQVDKATYLRKKKFKERGAASLNDC